MGPVTWLGSYIHSDLGRVGGAQREEVALELGVREAGNGDWMKDSCHFLLLTLLLKSTHPITTPWLLTGKEALFVG